MRACAAILVLLAGCTSPEPQVVIPAMAAAPPQCEVEWPADHTAAPVLACTDGSRQAIRLGTALVVGDAALAEALP